LVVKSVAGAFGRRGNQRIRLSRLAIRSVSAILLASLVVLLVPIAAARTAYAEASPAPVPPILEGEASGGAINASSEPAEKPVARLGFVGDILLNGTIGDLIEAEGPLAPWEGVRELLSSADITCGNLECAVGTTGTPIPGKTWTFRAEPATLQGLADSGLDVVSLANNHTLDFGEECLLETVDLVRAAGLGTIGAGADEAAAREPFIREVNGVKVGILATAVTVPTPDWAAKPDKPGIAVDYPGWFPGIVASIQDLSQRVDVVVVYVHWGDERTPAPVQWIERVHTAMRDAGAHAIIGSHPHVLHGVRYDGSTVTAYSLGNFVFSTNPEYPDCQIGAILNLTVSKGKIEAVELVPTKIVWGKTYPMEGEEREGILAKMSSLSRPMGSDVDMDGSVVPLIYTDMHNHWARFTVGKLSSRGSIKGYEDQTFRPDNRITKGEFAAMFVRAVATETEVEAAVAADASASEGCKVCFPEHWSYPYLRYLAGVGAIPSGDAQWEPNIPCSRRDAISAMWALTVRPAKSETPEGAGDPGAAGAPAGATDPEAAVVWATQNGILRGYPDGSLRLDEVISRAEMAVIVSRYLDLPR
jgi:poly-gamma-glutamate capsule biosynthesis protein CapA/YwtB (metallophosphatase superfamily)